MSESIYVIYKHTSPSGKSYIGQTKHYETRMIQHQRRTGCRAFHAAITKYGWDNFVHEIICEGLTIDEANECEELMISEHTTLSPNGYNLHSGGLNRKPSEETLLKLKSHTKTPEHIEKIASQNRGIKRSLNKSVGVPFKKGRPAWNKGVPLTPEQIEKRTATQKANKLIKQGLVEKR